MKTLIQRWLGIIPGNNDIRNEVIKTTKEYLDKNVELMVSARVPMWAATGGKEAMEKHIAREEFIDAIVERIKKKQL